MHWATLAAAFLIKASATPCTLPSVQKPAAMTSVSIAGDIDKPFAVTANDADRFTRLHAHVHQPSDAGPVDGDFEGISIVDLLRAAGARVKATKAGLVDSIIVAQAALDNPSRSSAPYEVIFSFAETSPHLSRHPAFLAFRCNGAPITPTLVAPDDLTADRYVHELSSLTFRTLK